MCVYIKCFEPKTNAPIYVNMDSVLLIQRNDKDDYTGLYTEDPDTFPIRVKETPDQIAYLIREAQTQISNASTYSA